MKSLLLFISSLLILTSCASSKLTQESSTIGSSAKDLERKRSSIISNARAHIGTKYKAGGKTPAGFDCSGFSFYIFKENGIALQASSTLQSSQGIKIKTKDLEKGDLLFFGSGERINHVGIVTKNEKGKLSMIHSSSSRGIIEEDITESAYWQKRLLFGRRVLNY